MPNELVLSPEILRAPLYYARAYIKIQTTMRRTAFPSLLLHALIAVATFTFILTAPINLLQIHIIGYDHKGNEACIIKTNVGEAKATLGVPCRATSDLKSVKFLTDLHEDCDLLLSGASGPDPKFGGSQPHGRTFTFKPEAGIVTGLTVKCHNIN
jgi:hypothetical protein